MDRTAKTTIRFIAKLSTISTTDSTRVACFQRGPTDRYQVKGVASRFQVVLFELEPVHCSPGGLVRGLQVIHDKALRSSSDCFLQELLDWDEAVLSAVMWRRYASAL